MTDETVTLAYTEWALVELGSEPVVIPRDQIRPTIVLDLEEARVTGSGGMNRLTGRFAMTGGELRFGRLATTRMAGPERQCVARRGSSRRSIVSPYELDGRTLTLLAEDGPVARLSC